MSNLPMETRLEGGEDLGGVLRFKPGQIIRGVLAVYPQDQLNCQPLQIELQWFTQGRGTRNQGTEASIEVYRGELIANVPGEFAFEIGLPLQPYTYVGRLIQVHWRLWATAKLAWKVDPDYSYPIVIAPDVRMHNTFESDPA